MTIANTFPGPEEWTDADRWLAEREGWNVFDADGSGNGRTQIQRYDEDAKFDSDKDAWLHVWRRAEEGSPVHQRALAAVKKHNPAEYALIEGVVRGRA